MTNARTRNLRLLAVLDAVLSERHVSRAAQRLHLSQPAISSALAQLRAFYGDPLLVRHGRELLLTPFGRELLPEVRAAMTAAHRVFDARRAFEPATLERHFHIAVSDAVGQTLVPEVVGRLAREAPRVTVRLSAAPSEPSEAHFVDHRVDIVVSQTGRTAASLRTMTLAQHPLVVVARDGHPALRRGITMRRLAQQQHLVIVPHDAAIEQALRTAYKREKLEFRLLASVQQMSAAAAIVARTDAVALLSAPLADLYAPAFALRVHALPAELSALRVAVRALWHERDHTDPAAAWLRGLFKDCARL